MKTQCREHFFYLAVDPGSTLKSFIGTGMDFVSGRRNWRVEDSAGPILLKKGER